MNGPAGVMNRLILAARSSGVLTDRHLAVFSPLYCGFVLRTVDKRTAEECEHLFAPPGMQAPAGQDDVVIHHVEGLTLTMTSEQASEVIISYLEAMENR